MSDPTDYSIFGGESQWKPAQEAAPQNALGEQPSRQDSHPVPVFPDAETIAIERMTFEEIEAFFPSENAPASTAAVGAAVVETSGAPAQASSNLSEAPKPAQKTDSERRAKRRAQISAAVRVRSIDLTHNGLDDITMTVNVSRIGVLLTTLNPVYLSGMDVMVTFPYSKAPTAIQPEQPGRVLRVTQLPDGRRSVAIVLGVTHRDEEFISASGEKLHADSAKAPETPEAPKFVFDRDPNSLKPLVLALDAEQSVRESLKNYLLSEGYDVIAVTNAQEARHVLNQCTPSLLIAEVEGEGTPGYDLCSHCKSTPRLQSVPVMLTTSSAYPSDYATAHSLGAVVCMAKPYRQERLGHVVRLLAPPQNGADDATPPHTADPTRRHLGAGKATKSPSNVNRRFRFGRI